MNDVIIILFNNVYIVNGIEANTWKEKRKDLDS